MTTAQMADADDGTIDLTDALGPNETICGTSDHLYVMETEDDGSLTGVLYEGAKVDGTGKKLVFDEEMQAKVKGKSVLVDYYVVKQSSSVSEIQIDAANFAGYYYVEADTLFRRQTDGFDAPANITIPNVKIQSNFTFSMAASGDPSTLKVGVAA